jgi:formylglycine-generating enzyme required for sulfatase activity
MDNLDLDERNERSGGGAESARGPAFVSIQPGEFLMGCDAGARECKEDEKPPRLIRMTKAFEIGKHEVTQGEWQSVMGNNPSNFKGSSRPVENIRWTDAQEFLKRLNARNDGYRYRLPTEAEWEYAARAGGAGPETASVDKHAWHEGNSGFETRPGGQAQPNVWGLHDMLGNVAEWVEDWYGAAFAGAETTDPKGPASGRERVVRGGSWFNQATELRVSARDQLTPDATSDRVGFRIVREAAR